MGVFVEGYLGISTKRHGFFHGGLVLDNRLIHYLCTEMYRDGCQISSGLTHQASGCLVLSCHCRHQSLRHITKTQHGVSYFNLSNIVVSHMTRQLQYSWSNCCQFLLIANSMTWFAGTCAATYANKQGL